MKKKVVNDYTGVVTWVDDEEFAGLQEVISNPRLALPIEKPALWTRYEVTGVIERLQPNLLPHYHAGLWGSVLTKGESKKDFDLIIIPHEPLIRNDYTEIAEILIKFGFTDRQTFGSKTPDYNDGRHIEKWKYNGKRVDVFNLNAEIPLVRVDVTQGIASKITTGIVWLP